MTTLQTKKRKYMIGSVILVAIVVAIAVFGVMLAYQAPLRFDMTGQRLFELSGETRTVIDMMQGDVKIGAVFPEGKEDAMVATLLKEYDAASDQITVEYLDVEKTPGVLANYDLGDVKAVANGTLIVNGNGKSKLIAYGDLFTADTNGNLFYGESEITGALRYVSTDTMPVAYFLQGHGEINPGVDMTEAVSLLERNAYAVNTLSLANGQGVPEDASVVIAASPTTDLSQEEYDALNAYLDGGGSLLLMVDPTLSKSDDGLVRFGQIAEKYGIGIQNNFVFEEEPNSYLTTSNLYVIPKYGVHEITAQLIEDQKFVILPLARGLTAIGNPTVLLQTSADSWMRTDVSIADENKTDADTQGPIVVAYAAQSNVGNATTAAVVIGDSNFATDASLPLQGNADLLINSVNWLNGGREAEIISGKVINSSAMMVRGDDFIKLMVICCVVIPLVMFVGAILVWRTKRNK